MCVSGRLTAWRSGSDETCWLIHSFPPRQETAAGGKNAKQEETQLLHTWKEKTDTAWDQTLDFTYWGIHLTGHISVRVSGRRGSLAGLWPDREIQFCTSTKIKSERCSLIYVGGWIQVLAQNTERERERDGGSYRKSAGSFLVSTFSVVRGGSGCRSWLDMKFWFMFYLYYKGTALWLHGSSLIRWYGVKSHIPLLLVLFLCHQQVRRYFKVLSDSECSLLPPLRNRYGCVCPWQPPRKGKDVWGDFTWM